MMSSCVTYPSSNIVRVIKSRRKRWVRNVALWGKRRTYRDVVRKYEGKRPLGRLTLRCEDNIKANAQRKMDVMLLI